MDEDTYLAFIHYKLLEFSMKVCIFYQYCCIGVTQSGTITGSDSKSGLNLSFTKYNSSDYGSKRSMSENHISNLNPVPPFAREQVKAKFFKETNILESDAEIVEYFSEVVKEQQALELSLISDNASPVIRLDYTPCILFKNNIPKKIP